MQHVGQVIEKIGSEVHVITKLIADLLKFKWLVNLFKAINRIVEWLVTSTIRMLEGEGGLLWALVFLVLITSIIVTYRIIS